MILEAENLTVEDVSHMLGPDTFSVWQQGCYLAKDTIEALQNVTFAITHRYSSPAERDHELDEKSAHLVNCAVECLGLIRPTCKSRAGSIIGLIGGDRMLKPQSFQVSEPAEVPEVQKLFTIRKRDIEALRNILPEFLQLYSKDAKGKLTDEYEPFRMAVQLYGEAYALHY